MRIEAARYSGAFRAIAGFAVVVSLTIATAARADLKICNRMSYVADIAIGVDDKAASASRGWFRIEPAACRVLAQGALDVDRILLHARALALYGAAPAPQNGADKLCVAPDDFTIAGARQACRPGQTAAAFTEVKPSPDEDGNMVAYLAEGSDYDDEQARLAGIQRLLTIAGYDAAPIDGVDGPKTQAALAAFLKARGLAPDAALAPDFFTMLIDAVQAPGGPGVTWCNDTTYRVMASLAIDDGRRVTARGWYRIEPGKCVHPDMAGQPRRVFSFAEAVDADGRAIKAGDKALEWGGSALFCTREAQFEISEHSDCVSRGLIARGYAVLDMGTGSRTLRFATP